MINGFFFFWLVVFAVIGLLCVLVGGIGLAMLLYIWLEKEREER
jgi:hypothetical protein